MKNVYLGRIYMMQACVRFLFLLEYLNDSPESRFTSPFQGK